mgnify:CR=1 FL=1
MHASAKKRRYVAKNEKTKKWVEYLVDGLLDAKETTELFELTMEELNISSKKDRMALQNKLADEQMAKMLKTVLIGKMRADGAGSEGDAGGGAAPRVVATLFLRALDADDPLGEAEVSLLSKDGALAGARVTLIDQAVVFQQSGLRLHLTNGTVAAGGVRAVKPEESPRR